MKKEINLIVFLAATLLIFSLLPHFTVAAEGDVPGSEGLTLPGGITPDQFPESPEDAGQVSRDYLAKKWGEVFASTAVGKVLTFMSPIFKFFIGLPFTFSWLFFLTLIFWIAIVVILYKAIKEPLQFKGWICFLIAVIIPTIAAQLGMISKFASMFVPLFTNTWAMWGAFIGVIIVLFIYAGLMTKFGKGLKEKQKQEIEAQREQKAQEVEKLHDIEIKGTNSQ